MRVIKVPADISIKVKNQDNSTRELPMIFKDWLQSCLDAHEPFTKGGGKMARLAAKLADRIEKANGEIKFEDAEYDHVTAAVEAGTLAPIVKRQVLGFYDAVEGAEVQTPGVEEKANIAKEAARAAGV